MCGWLTCRWFCAPPVESSSETKMMIDKLDPMAAICQRKKAKHRDMHGPRSSLSFVGLGDDPFGISNLFFNQMVAWWNPRKIKFLKK